MALDITKQQDVEQAVGDPIAQRRPSIGGLPAVRQFAAQRKAGFCETLPQPAALAELEQEMLLQLFLDTGNPDEAGRRDLPDVDGNRIDRLREVDGAAEDELHHLGIATFGNVAKWQVTNRFKWLV